jgi:dTMP kinase
VAAQRAAHRERSEPGRGRDRFEADAGLQERTADVYTGLATAGWVAPWTVLESGAGNAPAELVAQLLG